MDDQNKKLFLSGVIFRGKKSNSMYFLFKSSPFSRLGMICITTSIRESTHFFANISKIDLKGFNYYTYEMIGKKRFSARVNFTDLIFYPKIDKEEMEVYNG